MTRRGVLGGLVAGLTSLTAAAVGAWAWRRDLTDDEIARIYAAPTTPPTGPLHVYHLGHSLVGRDMPSMLAQLAPKGHRYESQLGWGTTLKSHWNPDEVPIHGFERENAHPHHRDPHDALSGGGYDAFVLTEMVNIRDAIRYFDSWKYLLEWTRFARHANPDVRLYLYETWHNLDDPEGWLERLDLDFDRSWDRRILRPAMAADEAVRPIFVIPAGQVLASFVRQVETQGGVDGIRSRHDLFARAPDGSVDQIHLGDLGNYLVALTHHAVLYRQVPEPVPTGMTRADGTLATLPSPEAAQLMRETVWDVVTRLPFTGVQPHNV